MKEISDDIITGLLLGDIKQAVKLFYADEIEAILCGKEVDAPGMDEIINQISTGMVGYGGVEIVDYKTGLEQALQGKRRADKFVEYMSGEIERWAAEHADFLRDLIRGPLAEEGLPLDADRVRKLAELLEKKQDAFPPMLLAAYALGPGWDRIFAVQ
jgi:hypothetical protein